MSEKMDKEFNPMVSLTPEEIRLRSEILKESEKILGLTKQKEFVDVMMSLVIEIITDRIFALQKTLNKLRLMRENLEKTK